MITLAESNILGRTTSNEQGHEGRKATFHYTVGDAFSPLAGRQRLLNNSLGSELLRHQYRVLCEDVGGKLSNLVGVI